MAAEKKGTGSQLVGVKAVSEYFGVSTRMVQELRKEGIIEAAKMSGRNYQYDLQATVRRYIQYLKDESRGKTWSEKAIELKEQKLRAEIALKESQAELHQIRCEIAAGKYIAKEEVTLSYQNFFVVFKRFAMAIPVRMVGMISDKITPLEGRQIEKELNEEIKRMLMSFVIAGNKPEEPRKRSRKKPQNGKA